MLVRSVQTQMKKAGELSKAYVLRSRDRKKSPVGDVTWCSSTANIAVRYKFGQIQGNSATSHHTEHLQQIG